MHTWAITDPGCVRHQNQDTYSVQTYARDRALLLVCDGMGGAKAGDVASKLAAEVFSDEIRRSQKANLSREAIDGMLSEALALANKAVYEQAQLSEEFSGMGTTLVAAYLHKNEATILNVGDSRAYHISDQGIELVTRDHSVVSFMVMRGDITPEEAKNHPGKNLITRAVGIDRTVEGDIFTVSLEKNDCILLCSDGLSNEMADQEILFEVAQGMQLSDCCQRLLSIAVSRGAPDNVTVVLAEL